MRTNIKYLPAGFTLIEFIVALVVAAIVAAMVFTYFGNALTQSGVPIQRLKSTSNLYAVMDEIVADYNKLNKINLRYKWRAGKAYSLGDVVLPSTSVNNDTSSIDNSNGRYYVCTSAGNSSNTLPSWTSRALAVTTIDHTIAINDGGVVWKEAGFVWQAGRTYPASAIVLPVTNNGHFYQGPAIAFTSIATAPAWPTAFQGTADQGGGLIWTEVGTILNAATASIPHLYDVPSTSDTGGYLSISGRYGSNSTVVASKTGFIKFSGTSEVPAGTDERSILKVTIEDINSAATLTQLFTIR